MHVVVVVMVVMVMVMVVMHLVHFAPGRRGSRSGFLRQGVARNADRESGGGKKSFHHGWTILRLTDDELTCGYLRRFA